mgnify:FL=1|tara:strand:+ start:136 stop:456 length:321 start_codon:yes stop_codon:yes gene_type:complete
MKNFLLIFLLINLLYACQSVSEGFKLKENNSDEFLVEKKNPLVLPPSFDELPVPNSTETLNQKNTTGNFETILSKKSSSDNQKIQNGESTSTEEFILKNIKKNDSN